LASLAGNFTKNSLRTGEKISAVAGKIRFIILPVATKFS
jgi:hypothetical protein